MSIKPQLIIELKFVQFTLRRVQSYHRSMLCSTPLVQLHQIHNCCQPCLRTSPLHWAAILLFFLKTDDQAAVTFTAIQVGCRTNPVSWYPKVHSDNCLFLQFHYLSCSFLISHKNSCQLSLTYNLKYSDVSCDVTFFNEPIRDYCFFTVGTLAVWWKMFGKTGNILLTGKH